MLTPAKWSGHGRARRRRGAARARTWKSSRLLPAARRSPRSSSGFFIPSLSCTASGSSSAYSSTPSATAAMRGNSRSSTSSSSAYGFHSRASFRKRSRACTSPWSSLKKFGFAHTFSSDPARTRRSALSAGTASPSDREISSNAVSMSTTNSDPSAAIGRPRSTTTHSEMTRAAADGAGGARARERRSASAAETVAIRRSWIGSGGRGRGRGGFAGVEGEEGCGGGSGQWALGSGSAWLCHPRTHRTLSGSFDGPPTFDINRSHNDDEKEDAET